MTTYKAIPQPTDNRNQSQVDLLANFTYLTDVSTPGSVLGVLPVDHRITGDNTLNPSDGFHNQVSYLNRVAPSTLTNTINGQASNSITYAINDSNAQSQLHHYNGTNDFQVTPCLPLRASISFNGNGTFTAYGTPFNVNTGTSTRDGTGLYTIQFTNALPSANYVALITGMRSASGEVISFIQGAASKSTSVTTTFIKIGFESTSGTARDVIVGNVMIFGG